MIILGGPESFRPNMADKESELGNNIGQSDAGQRARTDDMIEALVEQRALEDSERKASEEAAELKDYQHLE